MKVIHMTASVMATKRQKLLKCSRAELIAIDSEVRAELNQPWIADVLNSRLITKAEIANDIMSVVKNSVINNFKTICNG